MLVGIDRKN